MEEKLICCCGSSGWTKVIGWFLLVWSGISTMFFAITLLGSAAVVGHIETSEEEPLILEETLKTIFTAAASFSLFKLIMSFLAIIMSIVLLVGSYNRNSSLIQCWIVYQVIYLIVWALREIFQMYVQEPIKGVTTFAIVTGVFALGIEIFCLWVVCTHKKEIDALARHIFPVKA